MNDNVGRHGKVTENVVEVALDCLAVGIDPAKATLFIQSQVPELAERFQYLLNLVTVPVSSESRPSREKCGSERDMRADFPVHPVSPAADITAFKATPLPVGAGQLPMIGPGNDPVRQFNNTIGKQVPVACEAARSTVTA